MVNKSVSNRVILDKELLGIISGLGGEYTLKCSQFLPEKERVDVLMGLFWRHYDSGQLSEAQKVAQLLTESQRLDRMPKFIVSCLKDVSRFSQDFDKVRQMAQWLPEPQRTTSLRHIRKRSLDVGDLGSAVEISHLLNQPLRFKDVIGHFNDLSANDVKFNAERLPKPLRVKVLEEVLPRFIEKGFLDCALKVVGLLGRDLTSDELEAFRVVCISSGSLDEARKVVALQERPLSVDELEKLFNIQYSEKTFYYHIAWEIANLMPKTQRTRKLNKLLKRSLKEGSIYGFQDTLKHLGRRATDLELAKIFSTYKYKIEDAVPSRVMELVTLLPEPQRTDELTRILEWFCTGKGDLYYSQRAASLLGRELTIDELGSLLSKHKEAGSYQDMFHIGKLLPEPQRTNELSELIKLCKKDGYPSRLTNEVADYLLQIMEQELEN